MAFVYENTPDTPLGPDDVDGMWEFLDPENDIGPTWNPEFEDPPSYWNPEKPSASDCATVLHNLIVSNGGPTGVVNILANLKLAYRTALITGLARLAGVSPEQLEQNLNVASPYAATYLAKLDRHNPEQPSESLTQVETGTGTKHIDERVAELSTDLMVAILDDPLSPEVDCLITHLAVLLK